MKNTSLLENLIEQKWQKKINQTAFKNLPEAIQVFQKAQYKRWLGMNKPSKKSEHYRYFPFEKLAQSKKSLQRIKTASTQQQPGSVSLDALIKDLNDSSTGSPRHLSGWQVAYLSEGGLFFDQFKEACIKTEDPWALGCLLASDRCVFIEALAPEKPLYISHADLSTLTAGTEIAPPLFITIAPKQKATLLEEFGQTDQAACRYIHTTLGNGAHLAWSSLASYSEKRQLHYYQLNLSENAYANLRTWMGGGYLNRSAWHTRLNGAFSKIDWKGGYTATSHGHSSTHMRIDHLKPDTISSQQIKGLGAAYGTGIFQGLIKINASAPKSQASQQHTGWPMHASARFYARPELEIDTKEVTCTHGVALSPPKQVWLDYLASRGFSKEKGLALLQSVFFFDILPQNIFPSSWENYLNAHTTSPTNAVRGL